MKIAIISMIREPWGGSEELWADMAKEALKNGITIIHSTFDFGRVSPKEEQLIDRGLIHITRRGFIKPGTPPPIRIFRKLIEKVRNTFSNPFDSLFNYKPDFILYNGTCYSITSEKMLLKQLYRYQTSFGIIAHYNREDGSDATDREAETTGDIFKKAKNLFFISQRTLDILQKRTGQQFNNARIVRNPVNLTSLELVPFPSSSTFNFANVGNLRMIHKGQDIILRILAKENWSQRNWHLNLYGSGEDEAAIKVLVSELGLSERVTFHGKVTDIRKVWGENHLLLMPSRMEGMPLAVVEAMICGRPCVVSDVGGHKEWIDEGKQGWIAARPTVEDFANAMEIAWQQNKQWEQIGQSAHQKAMMLYDPHPGKVLLEFIQNS